MDKYSNLAYTILEYKIEIFKSNTVDKVIYSNDHISIVQRLKKAREDACLDQKQAAEKLGKTQSYISKVEAGQRRIDVVQLKHFARVYEKNLDYFLK